MAAAQSVLADYSWLSSPSLALQKGTASSDAKASVTIELWVSAATLVLVTAWQHSY